MHSFTWISDIYESLNTPVLSSILAILLIDKFFFNVYFKWKDQQEDENINIGIRRSTTFEEKLHLFVSCFNWNILQSDRTKRSYKMLPFNHHYTYSSLLFWGIWILNQLGVHKLLHFSFIAPRGFMRSPIFKMTNMWLGTIWHFAKCIMLEVSNFCFNCYLITWRFLYVVHYRVIHLKQA